MLTRQYRPKTFDDVVGQNVAKRILSAVAKSPKGKHQTYILQGPFGTGKSTLARVFGRALNCTGKRKPCMACKSCLSYGSILEDHRYREYDAAMMGNVADIRAFRESWYFQGSKEYNVIVFDECQMVSKEGQGALLSVTENPPPKVIFIFCTTDVHVMLPPLVSRSFSIDFEVLTDEEITSLVEDISGKEQMEISDECLLRIVRRSAGHARDAVTYIQALQMLGEDAFLDTVVISDVHFSTLSRMRVRYFSKSTFRVSNGILAISAYAPLTTSRSPLRAPRKKVEK